MKAAIASTSPHNMRGDAGYVRDISAYGLRIITKKWKQFVIIGGIMAAWKQELRLRMPSAEKSVVAVRSNTVV